MLEFGDILTLENDEQYIVASSCEYNKKEYFYLVNINDATDCILGSVENDDLEIVNDEETFIKLMPLILDNADSRIFQENNDFNSEEDTKSNEKEEINE